MMNATNRRHRPELKINASTDWPVFVPPPPEGQCTIAWHEALKKDAARLAAETTPLGTVGGARLVNCRRCGSTLGVR